MVLAGSEWGFSEQPEIYIHFSASEVSGASGCNRFAGRYEVNGTKLLIKQLAVTQMACADDAVMREEQRFLGILNETAEFEATHLRLVLKNKNAAPLAVLKRRDWD